MWGAFPGSNFAGQRLGTTTRLWLLMGTGAPLAVVAATQASHAETDEDAAKLSIEQQRQLLKGVYAAFWGFKLFAVGVVICILGLHGACCLFPNYKRGDAVGTLVAGL